MKYQSHRAFTLIELLIVISVVAMLSSIIMANVESARAKGRDSLREQQTEQIDSAVQLYIHDNGHAPYLKNLPTACDVQTNAVNKDQLEYPTDITKVSGCFAVSTASVGSPQKMAWDAFKEDINQYIGDFPDDPCEGGCSSSLQGNTGYVYSSPLVMQYLCGVNCQNSVSGLNSSYQAYAKPEKKTTYIGTSAPTSTSVVFDPNADVTPPTAKIVYDYPSNFSYYGVTSRNVEVTLFGSSEPITITNNNGSNKYTFTENGSFTFNFVDAAGNQGSTTATVSKMIKWSGTQSTSINWTDANTLCSQKDGGGIWRLPKTLELQEGLSYQGDVGINLGFYTNRHYWTSYMTSGMAATQKVDFSRVVSAGFYPITDRYSVNCVR